MYGSLYGRDMSGLHQSVPHLPFFSICTQHSCCLSCHLGQYQEQGGRVGMSRVLYVQQTYDPSNHQDKQQPLGKGGSMASLYAQCMTAQHRPAGSWAATM
jgi:hypothetical protein